ncbi:MAG: type II toxin-antitoxin system prevent-host-death family antitoxin [Fibrobacterota bacterium]|nr:type II toxin-antitoxin system prevent-host-death family antitoxin [Chitinispirillaceae bacterium]
MNASILDLRYKMKDVLQALERREQVTISYHGVKKGVIVPATSKKRPGVSTNPFFGMYKTDTDDPVEIVNKMRKGRYNDI